MRTSPILSYSGSYTHKRRVVNLKDGGTRRRLVQSPGRASKRALGDELASIDREIQGCIEVWALLAASPSGLPDELRDTLVSLLEDARRQKLELVRGEILKSIGRHPSEKNLRKVESGEFSLAKNLKQFTPKDFHEKTNLIS